MCNGYLEGGLDGDHDGGLVGDLGGDHAGDLDGDPGGGLDGDPDGDGVGGSVGADEVGAMVDGTGAAGGAEEVLVPGRLYGWELRSGFAVLGWVAGEVEAGRVGQGSGHHKG